jgi:protein-S-isoprenylcysteine O-methyltransferase Ste14
VCPGARFAVLSEVMPSLARPRCVSDWMGFVFYSVLAGTTLEKMPALGILLMPTLALELFAAISFLIREPARASDRTGRARITAYGGTLFVLVFLLFANTYYPHWLSPTESGAGRVAGVVMWIAGSAWAAYSVWYLRYAFSIEPEARRLISRGPYEVARHPVYLGYFGQYLGVWLLFPTVQFGVGLLVWLLLMLDRMRNEERVLARAFPEYGEYRRRVSALGF